MGKQRTNQPRRKKKKKGDLLLTLALIAAIAVFCFAAYNLFHIYTEYKKGTDEYNHIEQMAVTDRAPEDEELVDAVSGPKPPISVDFDTLKSVNPDVVGWIYIEALDNINYPVVQGDDNETYLHTTYENNYNFAGTIFVDYENSSDFSDCNTLIYGHNMKNGSMFGLLSKHFKDQESVPGRYIWICTPDKNYRYEIFSSHVVDAAGEVYTLFSAPDEQFASYLEKMKSQSLVDFQTEVTAEDKVITLSTCTGNDATRFVVQAKREGTY